MATAAKTAQARQARATPDGQAPNSIGQNSNPPDDQAGTDKPNPGDSDQGNGTGTGQDLTGTTQEPQIFAVEGDTTPTVTLKAPEGATSFTWRGIVHTVEDGLVKASHLALEELRAHGFDLHVPDQEA